MSSAILNSAQAARYLRRVINPEIEEFWVLALSSCKNLIRSTCLFRGTVDSCLYHPRDVFRFACFSNASSILVGHNHPLGEALPSTEDLNITQTLFEASRLMQMPLVDHIILGRKGYFSFADKGLLIEPRLDRRCPWEEATAVLDRRVEEHPPP